MTTRTKLLVFALALGSGSVLTAQEAKSPTSSNLDQLGAARKEYSRLSNLIYSYEDPESQKSHIFDKDQVAEIVGQMHKIIEDQILAMLASAHPDAPAIARAVEQIQGPTGLGPWKAGTNTPFTELLELNSGRSLAVTYAILRGGAGMPDTLSFLEFYGESGGQWSLVARADSNLTHSTLFVRRVTSPLSGQAWFLVWGTRIGSSAAQLNIRLYGFDGVGVRTISRRDDLISSDIKVSDKSITLDYDPEFHAPFQNRVHETLYITPSGLK